MIKKISIGKRVISDSNIPLVVAEISANHQNSLKKTIELLKKASKANVEAVKFQTFDLNEMNFDLNKKEFLIKKKFKTKNWNNRTLHSIYKEAQFPFEWHKKVFKEAKRLGLVVFSSVFDEKSLFFLEKLNVPMYKIASLESLHFPLIEKVAKTKKPLIISSGMAYLDEIARTVRFAKEAGAKQLAVLHCTSVYPCEDKMVNLKAINTMEKSLNLPIGYSDHTEKNYTSIHASSLGACMIERHVKLENFKSVDSFFSSTILS